MQSKQGRLEVTIVSAKGLRDTAVFGVQEPYVKVRYGLDFAKTKRQKTGGTAPVWEETLVLGVSYGSPTNLEVKVKSPGVIKDDLLGATVINLESVFSSGEAEVAAPLFLKEVQRGEIQLFLRFTAAETFSRAASRAASLASLAQAEDSSTSTEASSCLATRAQSLGIPGQAGGASFGHGPLPMGYTPGSRSGSFSGAQSPSLGRSRPHSFGAALTPRPPVPPLQGFSPLAEPFLTAQASGGSLSSPGSGRGPPSYQAFSSPRLSRTGYPEVEGGDAVRKSPREGAASGKRSVAFQVPEGANPDRLFPSAPPLPDLPTGYTSPRPRSSGTSFTEHASQNLPPGLPPPSAFRAGSASPLTTPGEGPPYSHPLAGLSGSLSASSVAGGGSLSEAAKLARQAALFAEVAASAIPSAPPLDPSLPCEEWPPELTAAALAGAGRSPFAPRPTPVGSQSQPASSAPSASGAGGSGGRRRGPVRGAKTSLGPSGRWVGGQAPPLRVEEPGGWLYATPSECSPTAPYRMAGRGWDSNDSLAQGGRRDSWSPEGGGFGEGGALCSSSESWGHREAGWHQNDVYKQQQSALQVFASAKSFDAPRGVPMGLPQM